MTIGVGGSTGEKELAAMTSMRGDVPPIGVELYFTGLNFRRTERMHSAAVARRDHPLAHPPAQARRRRPLVDPGRSRRSVSAADRVGRLIVRATHSGFTVARAARAGRPAATSPARRG